MLCFKFRKKNTSIHAGTPSYIALLQERIKTESSTQICECIYLSSEKENNIRPNQKKTDQFSRLKKRTMKIRFCSSLTRIPAQVGLLPVYVWRNPYEVFPELTTISYHYILNNMCFNKESTIKLFIRNLYYVKVRSVHGKISAFSMSKTLWN